DQHIAALAVLGEAWRRSRVAGNNDHPVSCLEPESERGQIAVPYRKSGDADVAIDVDDAGRDLMRVNPAAVPRQPVDARHAILDVDLPRLEHMPSHRAQALRPIDVERLPAAKDPGRQDKVGVSGRVVGMQMREKNCLKGGSGEAECGYALVVG